MKHVLYIGPDPRGRGGISSVIREYQKYSTPYFCGVYSHVSGSIGKKLLLLVWALIKVLFYLYRGGIKIVHIHTASRVSFFRKSIFVLLSKIFRKKVVLHIHGGAFCDFVASYKGYTQWILGHVDLVITVSDSLRQSLKEMLGPDLPKMSTLYNPIEFPCSRIQKRVEANSKINILFLGAICENKGIRDILQCMLLHQEYLHDRVMLHIGGVGELSRELEHLLTTRSVSTFITYHGWVEGESKNKLLCDADIYIQPSYIEALPISVLEAMSYRTAVIASHIGGLPEIVHDHETGLLIEPGKPEKLFEAMKYLIENDTLRESFSRRGVRIAEQAYLPNIMAQLEVLYKELI